MSLKLSSEAFSDHGEIPSRYTCEGSDSSPPLSWTGAPSGTKSFALIVDDPDAPDPKAPKMTWVHWVVFNIPGATHSLPEGFSSRKGLPRPMEEGLNDWKRSGYGGPCPPIGRHRYFFKLYALDAVLGELKTANKAGLIEAMKGHVLEEAQLMGTYEKKGSK